MTDPFNSALENSARYDDIKIVKHLFKNYHNLRKLGQMGNQSAIAIYLDLEYALNHQSLTFNQRFFIIKLLIENETLEYLAEKHNKNQNTIYLYVQSGIKKVIRLLEEGRR